MVPRRLQTCWWAFPHGRVNLSSAGQHVVCRLLMVAKLLTSVFQLKALIRLEEFIPLYLFIYELLVFMCTGKWYHIEKTHSICELGIMLHCLISGRNALLAMWSSWSVWVRIRKSENKVRNYPSLYTAWQELGATVYSGHAILSVYHTKEKLYFLCKIWKNFRKWKEAGRADWECQIAGAFQWESQ